MHRALQHLSLTGPLDEEDIRGQLVKMRELEILTGEQVEAVEVENIARVFASPLGERLRRGRLMRVPFSPGSMPGRFTAKMWGRSGSWFRESWTAS